MHAVALRNARDRVHGSRLMRTYRPASEKPPAPGVYAVLGGMYRMFDGTNWFYGNTSISRARQTYGGDRWTVHPDLCRPWRETDENDYQ